MECMDKDQLPELALYYIALLLLVFFILEVLQAAVGEISFWIEMVIILGIVFTYRYIAVWLGIAPSSEE
ncbi:hypothetical protein HISP_15940 [Haloarcula hispanica N601]|uniref:Uncharacterized protein n=3 Tax=Haloarcula hispanica TaxID=51589 RepID=V5TQH8_HALHI|nr:conserved hypothetical protein [Haloarcula hispanica ATCC 33960]AHB67566.1 hypothetical protein HISP_15940 [Haloarcula hispanica N601]